MVKASTDVGVPVWRPIGTTPVGGRSASRPAVVIVGAGPVGLTLALDLGRRGHHVVVLNRRDFIAGGSKAICFAKRTLDIWDRLGVGEAIVRRGVAWNVGKVYRGDRSEPIYSFDMLPVKQQKMPGFINLQQYLVEEMLVEALGAMPNVELRWGHEVVEVEPRADGVAATISAGAGQYELDASWLVACDGSRSPVRGMLGLDFEGRAFEDNFLIADIRLKQERAAERCFWFDPPANRGKSALLHRQPDDVWRLDFQLGWGIDRDAFTQPQNVEPYIRGMLGDVDFTPEWYSVYTFQCRRMARFVHGRVVFAGDSAHLVSPFGARGCNGGIADADNLGWKLDAVLEGRADERLIETYNDEAIATADENILNSTRSADFMTPRSSAAAALREAVLELAGDHAFARPFVNSGRLSTAVRYGATRLSSADEPEEAWAGIPPGSVASDAPTAAGWLLEHISKGRFVLLGQELSCAVPDGVVTVDISIIGDPDGLIAARFDLARGSAYLLRPDHYVAARWREPTAAAVAAAYARALGGE